MIPNTASKQNHRLNAAFLFALLFWVTPACAEKVLKFATLAPEGSTWVAVLKDLDKELREKSQNQVRFKIYAGGVSGDEKDVLRKIRLGQLHGAGFTGVGLGEILPEVRVMDLPFLFASPADVDKVENGMFDHFAKAFDKKGYVLLGWADVGFVYFFSQKPIGSWNDLKKTKAWAWEGDPVAGELYKALDISPVALSVPDVLTSLQTGLIDTVYASPLAAVALQWFTKVKVMMDIPLTHATGAVLVSKRFMETLTPQEQTLLKEVSRTHLRRLNALTREEQASAIAAIRQQGISVQAMAPAQAQEFQALGRQVQSRLTGQLYSRDLLDNVTKLLGKTR